MITRDKAVLSVGSASTAASGSKSIVKDDSLVTAFLDSSLTDILAGNFTVYGSDLIAFASLTATLTMVGWRIYYDKKKPKSLKQIKPK